MQTTAIRTVANSLPENEVILLTLLISKRYIPYTDLRKIFVGQNINADEKWDICLESEFDTLEDVKAYAVHPAHVAAAGILKEAKQDRACTDYIF